MLQAASRRITTIAIKHVCIDFDIITNPPHLGINIDKYYHIYFFKNILPHLSGATITYETFFQFSTLLAAPFWGVIIFAAKWEWTKRILASSWIAAPPAFIFAALTIPDLPHLSPV